MLSNNNFADSCQQETSWQYFLSNSSLESNIQIKNARSYCSHLKPQKNAVIADEVRALCDGRKR